MEQNIYPLPYGKDQLIIEIPAESSFEVFFPPEQPTIVEISDHIYNTIRNCKKFYELSQNLPADAKIAITINDKTRPVPNNVLFPPLFKVLGEIGIKPENITLVIATGTHTPMRVDEFDQLLESRIRQGINIVSHDCDQASNLVNKGTTRFGTPVYVNKVFDQADIKIVVGDIEPHHFAGFSGGAKSAAIGVCGRETITRNHNFLMDPRCKVGSYEDNPLRQDIEEIGELIGVDLALNAVLNEKKEILHILFDRPLEVMKKGVDIYRKHSLIKIDQPYDLVIASAGGFPKDINLYQAQKALTHASLFCKDGGTVLLVAACDEGVGSQSYMEFMRGVASQADAKIKFQTNGFSVGPHKAFQFATIAERIHFAVFCNIDPMTMDHLKIDPIFNLKQSIDAFLSQFHGVPRIAVLPYATATIPQT
jgi:nickel-dependent lactate racemase